MTKPIVYSLAAACSLVLTGASASAQLIGVDFSGRDNNDDPGDTLLPTESTGVFQQANWNAFISGAGQNNTTISNLVDSTGAASPITLSITSGDSWNASYDTNTPFGSLMDGIIKVQGVGNSMVFTFNNVPAGIYQLVSYTVENEQGATNAANYDSTVAGTGITYTTIGNNGAGFTDFVRASSTDPTARDLGNYVQFDNIVVTDGTILLTTTFRGGTDGIGIAGVQLQAVPEPTAFLMLASGAGMLGMLRRRRA